MTDLVDPILKSTLAFKTVEGYKYAVKISHTKSTAVNIIKAVDPGAMHKKWMVRFDNAHKNVPFAHLNLRHKYTGIKDPHLRLPPGTLYGAQAFAYISKALNYASYLALVNDGRKLIQAIRKDKEEGIYSNTLECASGITYEWVGAYVGATAGKVLGAAIISGIGPIAGALGLGILGSIYGGYLASFFWKNPKIAAETEEKMLFEKREMADKSLKPLVPSKL